MSRSNHHAQIINPTSVQSQFESLVNDKEKFSNLVSISDRERQAEEIKLQYLRKTQSDLTEKTRLASATLGTQQKKKSMLEDEVSRLNHVLDNDRKGLKGLSDEVHKLQQEDMARKFQFVKEMDGLNDELTDALRRFEECGFQRILDHFDLEACKLLGDFVAEMTETSSKANSRDQEQWSNLTKTMHGTMGRLSNAITACNEEKKHFELLMKNASGLRYTVQNGNTEGLGDTELNELERLWERQPTYDETDDESNLNTDPTNRMELVSDNHDQDYEQISQHSPQQQQQDPVNMHLFYGESVTDRASIDTMRMNNNDDSFSANKHTEVMYTNGTNVNMYANQ